MSIEADAQKDLALNAEDAENVVGGQKKKKKTQRHAVKHAAARPANINIQTQTTPVVESPMEDCDPGDPAALAPDSTGAEVG